MTNEHPANCTCDECLPPKDWQATIYVQDDYNREYQPYSVPVTKVGVRDANTGMPLPRSEVTPDASTTR